MSQQSLKSKTIKGTFWSFIDSFSSQGVSFLVGIVLARLLSPEEYGLIGILTIFISIFNSIVDSGFSNALIRKKDANDIDYNTVFYVNMFLSMVLCFLMYELAPFIASFFNQPQLTLLSKVMSFIIIINAFAIIQRTILVKEIDFKTQTKASFISSLASGVIGIVFALNSFGVWALVAQQLSRSVFYSVQLWIYARWYPRLVFSIQSFKELFSFGWKLLVSGLICSIWSEAFQIVIGKFYSAAVLGQYTRANQFASIFSVNITTVVQRVSFPVLSSIQDDKERLKAAYQRIIRSTVFVTFTLMLGLAAIAEPLISLLVGNQWLPCVPLLQILCFSMMLYPLHAINLDMLQVQGRSDLFLRLEIIKRIIFLGPFCLGIFFNIYYMLIGSVLMGFVAYYLNAYYSGPFLDYSIKEQILDILPSLGFAVITALPVYLLSYLPLPNFIMLFVQIVSGLFIVILAGEITRNQTYVEIKQIMFSSLFRQMN